MAWWNAGATVAKTVRNVPRVSKVTSDVSKGLKGLKASTSLKIGAIGGLGAFFGFEWLTNGGLVTATAGTFGVSNTAASIALIGVTVVGIAGVLYYFFGRRNKK